MAEEEALSFAASLTPQKIELRARFHSSAMTRCLMPRTICSEFVAFKTRAVEKLLVKEQAVQIRIALRAQAAFFDEVFLC